MSEFALAHPPLSTWRIPVTWPGGAHIISVFANSAAQALSRAQELHRSTVAQALTYGEPVRVATATEGGVV
jgi:hypothetical protein